MGAPVGNRSGRDGLYEPNMTPLIDVSLVLVVILMVATPMAFQSSIAVQASAAAARRAAQQEHEDRIEITVHADGTLNVNQYTIARDAFSATLKPLLATSASRLVVVRCEDAVPHGTFVGVLDEARSLGAVRLAVVGG